MSLALIFELSPSIFWYAGWFELSCYNQSLLPAITVLNHCELQFSTHFWSFILEGIALIQLSLTYEII